MKNPPVRSLLIPLLLGWAALAVPVAQAGVMGAPRAKPYPEAVRLSRVAAEAVLSRAGTESCLRGKLNRALLGLSASCEAAGEGNALCSLASKAVVVTPMTMVFMEETARRLLELSAPEAATAVPASRP